MATQRNEKKGVVDPKLRRKMLERWENEGGKIGEIESGPHSSGKSKGINTQKSRPARNSY